MIDRANKIISGENLCLDSSIIESGYTIRNCNLSQIKSHTSICDGVKGLIFEGCNLKNCDLPEDAIIEDSLVCHEDINVIEPEPPSADDLFQRGVDAFAAQCYPDDPDIQAAMKEAIATAISIKPAPIKRSG